jgi:hypothetical protein
LPSAIIVGTEDDFGTSLAARKLASFNGRVFFLQKQMESRGSAANTIEKFVWSALQQIAPAEAVDSVKQRITRRLQVISPDMAREDMGLFELRNDRQRPTEAWVIGEGCSPATRHSVQQRTNGIRALVSAILKIGVTELNYVTGACPEVNCRTEMTGFLLTRIMRLGFSGCCTSK